MAIQLNLVHCGSSKVPWHPYTYSEDHNQMMVVSIGRYLSELKPKKVMVHKVSAILPLGAVFNHLV